MQYKGVTFRKQLFYLIIIASCIRILIAGTTEFGNDEVYYYTYALHLQWNYFDHPPGVALLIRLTTLNMLLTNELFVRLGSILCAATGTWLSFKAGTLIRNERTGWYAAVLYNTSIYTSIIAGTFILPDSPQVVFWLAAMIVLIKMAHQLNNNKPILIGQWLLFALLTGICILCKVHGIFLWFGFISYLLLYKREIFLNPQLYIAGLITIIVFSPVIWWNINNHFVTWTYHSNRVAIHNTHINFNSFLQAFFGQIFYNNPVNVVLIAVAFYSYRTKKFLQQDIYKLLLFTGLPVIIVVSIISFFDNVLPHWSGPGFLTLNFIAAAYLDKTNVSIIKFPLALKTSIAVIFLAIIAGLGIINFYPGTIGNKDETKYGSGDFTLDLYGWNDFEHQYNTWLQQQSNAGYYKHLKFVCNKWFPAAHIEYYVARPIHTNVVGVGNLEDLHNFAWLNKTVNDLNKGEDALCIIPGNYSTNIEDAYQHQFPSITKLHRFTVLRNGKTARIFTLYLLKNYQPTDEVHTLLIQ
ncbi:MAG TPA: glycosyltransferase family 39 protein [Parafilimonas sp.]|nr:glycosyltransferase family 39 protein [Parafilimonas sp.]